MLEWLCPSIINPEKSQKSAVRLRQKGTGVWLLEGEEFQQWKTRSDSALWLHGIRVLTPPPLSLSSTTPSPAL